MVSYLQWTVYLFVWNFKPFRFNKLSSNYSLFLTLDDDSDDQYNEVDDYDIEETKRGTSESDENSSESDEDSSKSGEDSNESGEDSNESGEDSNESGEDSSEDKDEEEESDEKYYDPHLSLLGQRRKRLTLLSKLKLLFHLIYQIYWSI